MKRRVLRLHSNKKALRLLASTNHIRPPYQVVCDASFVRAFAAREKVRRVVDVVGEALGVPCEVCCIPETVSALERQQQQQQSEANVDSKKKASNQGKKQQVEPPVNAVLRQLVHVGRIHSPPKNELKAILAYTQDIAGSNSSTASAGGRFVFVATASHDLRKLLSAPARRQQLVQVADESKPSSSTTPPPRPQQQVEGPPACAFIRLTFNPTAAWIDVNSGSSSQREGETKAAGGAPSTQQSTTRRNASNVSQLSPADRAFMLHLNVPLASSGNTPQREKRGREEPPLAATPLPSTSQTVEPAGTKAAAPTPAPRRKKPAAPNPLSMKKRRVRETLVVGSVAASPVQQTMARPPAAKKQRTEGSTQSKLTKEGE